jgi:hypothetical protein
MGYTKSAARQAISTGTMLMMLPLLAGFAGPSIDQAVSSIQSSVPSIQSFSAPSFGGGSNLYISGGPIFMPQ